MDRFSWHPAQLALSVALLAGGAWVGLPWWAVLLLGGVPYMLAISSNAGIEFSKDGTRVREYQRIAGLKVGLWQSLPPVTGVTIKYFSELYETNPREETAWRNQKNQFQELLVLLSLHNSPTGFLIKRFPLNALAAARQQAQALAARFGVPVREYLAPQRTRRR